MRHFAFFLCSFLLSLSLSAAEEKPIPFWERPDYVLETPDIIEITVNDSNLPPEKLVGVTGTHLIGPDGHITLSFDKKVGKRLRVQDLTTAQCEHAVFECLSEQWKSDSFDVRVKVSACNSKTFHIVFQGLDLERQEISFPFTGHETVTKAIECCNGLVPEASRKLLVLRAAKQGKAVEMFGVDYDEALKDPKKDLPLRSGDTLLVRQDFRGEDIRPDGPILSDLFGDEQEDMLVTENDYEFPAPEPAEAESKTASQAVPKSSPSSGKRMARTVFFDYDRFGTEENLLYLTPLMENIKPESSVSFVVQAGQNGKNGGIWLIFYGDENTVTELHAVFKEIAEGK